MCWFLIITSFFFFLLRLPSLFEPYWYGDEGIYHVIGLALNHGRLLYRDIWDNKPPLLYVVYAIFHADQMTIRLVSLVTGIIAIFLFYFLSKKLFQTEKQRYITTGIFAFLFATPFIEGNIANAENFMIPLILATAILVVNIHETANTKNTNFSFLSVIRNTTYRLLFYAGLLLGIAFLFKVVAVFDAAAFGLFLFISHYKDIKHLKNQLRELVLLGTGFVVPLMLVVLYFLTQHALSEFIRSAFLSNVGYVNYGNKFIIPQGLLLIKLVILGIFVAFLFVKRRQFSRTTLFIALWLAFSIFNALFSQRPYTHYVLATLASFSLLIGLAFDKKKIYTMPAVIVLFILILLANSFYFYAKIIPYYRNFYNLLANRITSTQYQAFFDRSTPRDYALAQFLNTHSLPQDTLFIWGNNAQLYKLVNKLPPGRYIVAYHMTSVKNATAETQRAVYQTNPRYIIIMPGLGQFPYSLKNYQQRLNIDSATIYERVY